MKKLKARIHGCVTKNGIACGPKNCVICRNSSKFKLSSYTKVFPLRARIQKAWAKQTGYKPSVGPLVILTWKDLAELVKVKKNDPGRTVIGFKWVTPDLHSPIHGTRLHYVPGKVVRARTTDRNVEHECGAGVNMGAWVAVRRRIGASPIIRLKTTARRCVVPNASRVWDHMLTSLSYKFRATSALVTGIVTPNEAEQLDRVVFKAARRKQ